MAGLLELFHRKKALEICSAIVVAAGKAQRMEGIDKILAPLGELPVIVHTLYAFQDCQAIQEIIVVTRPDMMVEISRLCKEYGLDKVTKVVAGGAERTLSVQAGLKEVRPDADLIAIHDGARPLLTQDILNSTVAAAAKSGAAAPAISIIDTIKRVENGQTAETVDRSVLCAIQTPQVFESGLIRAALAKAVDDGEVLTDDCAAVEHLGMKVTLTNGSRENIKITTPFDLLLGTAILEARVKGGL